MYTYTVYIFNIYINMSTNIYIYVLYIHVLGNEYHHPVIRYKDINSTRTQPALNQVDITICTEYIASNPLNFIQYGPSMVDVPPSG